MGQFIRAYNISQFQPRTPPKYPADDLAYLTSQMRLGGEPEQDHDPKTPSERGSKERSVAPEDEDGSRGEENHESDDDEKPPQKLSTNTYPPPAPLANLLQAVEGWDITTALQNGGPAEVPNVVVCEVGFQGRVIVGVGGGTLFIWRLRVD